MTRSILLTLMLGLAPLASYIPMACLAGILLKVGIDIIDYRVLPVLHRLPVADAICFWAVLGLTISVDLLVAMGVGITIAFVRAVHELGNLYDQEIVAIDELEKKWPGEEGMPVELKNKVLKLRLDGPLFFGVSDVMYRTISQIADFKYLIIRMMRVPMVDMSGAFLLDDIIEKANAQGATVLITGMDGPVKETLAKLNIIDKIGEENCFDTFEEAAARVSELDANSTPRVLEPVAS